MKIRLWNLAALVLLLQALPAFAPTEIDTYFRKAKGNTVAERIESVSLAFYGVPFLDGPLGEGPQATFDQGPFFRFDGFDCTTFVETVVALATSKKAEEFEGRLKRIRYKGGKVGFAERNHFPCIDWIPNNVRSGLLTDITQEVAGHWGTQIASAIVNKKAWFEKLSPAAIRVPGLNEAQLNERLNQLHALGAGFALQTPALAYIPLDKVLTRKEVSPEEKKRREQEEVAFAGHRRTEGRQPQGEDVVLEKQIHDELIEARLKYLIQDVEVDPLFIAAIPSATILNIVRPGWTIPGTAMNISHQGFVIRKKEGTFFRHVSKSGGRAKDVPLANYLRLCLLSPAIKGIHLLRVN
jgi:hypothetical protein